MHLEKIKECLPELTGDERMELLKELMSGGSASAEQEKADEHYSDDSESIDKGEHLSTESAAIVMAKKKPPFRVKKDDLDED